MLDLLAQATLVDTTICTAGGTKEPHCFSCGSMSAASVELMQVLARACGHKHLNQFNPDDLTTWKREIAYLTGVKYAGLVPL